MTVAAAREGQSVFFRGVASCQLTMLHYVSPHPWAAPLRLSELLKKRVGIHKGDRGNQEELGVNKA